MRLLSRFATGLSLVALLAVTAAAQTPSPLRLTPDSADLLVQVKDPRRLAETVTNLDAVKQLQQFPYVQELLGSTDGRRYYQLLAYFEKELGAEPAGAARPPRRQRRGPVRQVRRRSGVGPARRPGQGRKADEAIRRRRPGRPRPGAGPAGHKGTPRQDDRGRRGNHPLRRFPGGGRRLGPDRQQQRRGAARRPRSVSRQVEKEHGGRPLRGGRRRPAAGRSAGQSVAQLRDGEADAAVQGFLRSRGAT